MLHPQQRILETLWDATAVQHNESGPARSLQEIVFTKMYEVTPMDVWLGLCSHSHTYIGHSKESPVIKHPNKLCTPHTSPPPSFCLPSISKAGPQERTPSRLAIWISPIFALFKKPSRDPPPPCFLHTQIDLAPIVCECVWVCVITSERYCESRRGRKDTGAQQGRGHTDEGSRY